MDWNQISELFDGQGLVFWAAVAAVTLGLTLLSVSIVFQVRKMLAGRTLRVRRPARRTPPRIAVTADGYRPEGFVPPAVAPTPAAPAAPQTGAETLPAALLERLRSAADRLEAIHSSLRPRGGSPSAGAHSGLKESGGGVDYVYKTGRA